jgi:general secretion pathway protein E
MRVANDSPYIEVKSPAGTSRIPIGDRPVTIGRHSTNVLVLADEQASRFHAVIERVPEGWRIRDLDSRNGIRINGEPARVALLLPGDVVTIGRSVLRIVLPAGAVMPAAAPVSDEPIPLGADATGAISPETILWQIVDALPDQSFDVNDITLHNSRGGVAHSGPLERSKKGSDGNDAPNIFRLLLLMCFRIHASDIHVEPKAEGYSIRIRVDGNMVDVVKLSKETGIKLTSMVKILCDIDIAQRNIIQEGNFSARVPDRRVDYRVSFAPAMYGQKLVIRILDTAGTPLHIDDMGLPKQMAADLKKAIENEAGMVLVCGPTGSGKTTTLYATVRDLDTAQRNVVTIEDPVEIQIDGVTQLPVKDDQGNTFSALLRSVLRQDPDVILVGEIRDPETAKIAMQASITGHLVLSTVHSRDTVGTVFRLLDLGVEPYLVAQGLHVVIAQRLVRQLCPNCKTPVKPTPQQLEQMGPWAKGLRTIFQPKGCQRCLGTGFAGRRAVFEMLVTNDALRDVILRKGTLTEMHAAAGPKFERLSSTGYRLVAEGVCPFDEIEKAVS